jgi:hypothetical protein
MPKDEFDFDDPMELNGVGLASDEDTTEAMTECFIEEFMRLGYNAKQILALFRNPHYLGMNMVVQNRGEQFVRDMIAEVFARWGKPVTWPIAREHPRTPALSPGERENRFQSESEWAPALATTTSKQSEIGQPLSPLPAGEGQGEGEINSTAQVALPREQIVAHDATHTDPTGAPIPILNP